MNNSQLELYGWQDAFAINYKPYAQQGYIPVRIYKEGKGVYWGVSNTSYLLLDRSGLFSNLQDLGIQNSPVIGDWCAVQQYSDDRGLIEGVFPRLNAFHRPTISDGDSIEGDGKAVAANVDHALLIQDCKNDFNLRRIERFVALLHADGIECSLILTKTDLVEEQSAYGRRVQARFPDLRVFLIDSITGNGVKTLEEMLVPRQTYLLLGTSGAGKSTLVNRLCEHDVAKVGDVRSQDGRGRHTTTSRELHLLPGGALLLDTPGIRAVGMTGSDSSVEESFSDIAQWALQCKYTDCTHTGERGCAVQKALQDGLLEQDRYFNFLRLREEAKSWDEVLQRSKEKKREIGKIQYQMRREGKR